MSTSISEKAYSGDSAVREAEVDSAAEAAFKGRLVSKPRARRFASRHTVPQHVAESLLAQYRAECGSGKEAARRARELLSDRLARPEDTQLLKMRASKDGPVRIIDRVEGEFDSQQGEPVVHFSRLGLTKVPVEEALAEKHSRLLKGGFYADLELTKEAASSSKPPFKVTELEPVGPSSLDLLAELSAGRNTFSDPAWLYFLVRSVGLAAPSEAISPRTAALVLLRLVPLVREQYSLLELGPRQTGKTYPYEELTPRAYVLSSGKATPSQLFVHAGTGEAGLVGTEDAVCLDEVTTASGLKEIASGLKSYLSSGAARRGKKEVQSRASVVMLGNIDRPVEEILEEAHLFEPLPEALGGDTAVMDRISAFMPGWEIPKLGPEHLASGLALPSEFLAGCLEELRKKSYARDLKQHLSLKGNLTNRDEEAAWETIGGLVKLIYPDLKETPSEEVLRWAAWLALEMRLRIRAQQHRLQSEEFEDGEFGFRVGGADRVTRVRLPEEQ